MTSSGVEWHFLLTFSHCYGHLVVKNGNFTLLLTSHGEDGQLLIATDI